MSRTPLARRIELDADNVLAYLRSRGIIGDDARGARASLLAGGVSNTVLRVDAPEGRFVVKQSLSVLRVASRWEFDPARIIIERRCLQALAALVPDAGVPSIVDHDDDAHVFTMTHAPLGGVAWRDELMAGRVRERIASRVGELLGRIQSASAHDPRLATAFDDLMPLEQGRIAPYHETAARANPDLADVIAADIARLRGDRRVLVLGDYSPKNLLAYDDGSVIPLDVEVAHFGDPAFDPAFLMSHLVLKGVHLPHLAGPLAAARRAFWAAYLAAGGLASERDAATETAALLLCRIDGTSPADYLDGPQRARIRAGARALLAAERGACTTLDDLDAIVRASQEAHA